MFGQHSGPNKCFGRILILITVRFFIVLGPTGAAMTAMHLGSEMCTQETAARQLDKIIFSPMSRLLCMPMWQCATASAWIRMVPYALALHASFLQWLRFGRDAKHLAMHSQFLDFAKFWAYNLDDLVRPSLCFRICWVNAPLTLPHHPR